MARSARESSHVSLFPFLAVLVCAMGALIFLLLVTTRQIRSMALERAMAPILASDPSEPEDDAVVIGKLDDFETSETLQTLAISGELPDDPGLLHPNVAPPVELKPQVIDRAAPWQIKVAELNEQLKRLRSQVDEKATRVESVDQLARLKSRRLEKLAEEIELANRTLAQKTNSRQAIVRAGGELLEKIEETRRQIKDSSLYAASASTRFNFMPYDAATGTVRRPILIECNEHGFVFRPESVSLTKSDFAGFMPQFNPLLAGAEALRNYWKRKDRNSQSSYGEPYVLLIVRPGGTIPYYVARRMLAPLGADFGYELIEDDADLSYPTNDAEAERVCRTAVELVLSKRDQLTSELQGRITPGRPGGWDGFGGGGSQRGGTQRGGTQRGGTGAQGRQSGSNQSGRQQGGRSISLSPDGTIVVTDPEQVDLESKAKDPNGWGEFIDEGRRNRGAVGTRGKPQSNGLADGSPANSGPQQGSERPPRNGQAASPPGKGFGPGDRFPRGPNPAQSRFPRPGNTAGAGGTGRFGNPQFANTPSGVDGTNSRPGGAKQPGQSGTNGRNNEGLAGTSPFGPPDRGGNGDDGQQFTDQSGRTASGGYQRRSQGDWLNDAAGAENPSMAERSGAGRGAEFGQSRPGGVPGGTRTSDLIRDSSGEQGGRPGTPSMGGANGTAETAAGSSAFGGGQPSNSVAIGGPSVQLGSRGTGRRSQASQDRSSKRRQWGMQSVTGTIGYEREVEVHVHPDRVQIGRYYIPLNTEVERGSLSNAVSDLIDLQARTWGAPPDGFYWVPSIAYKVHEDGRQQYQRLYGITRELGLSATARMASPPAPTTE